nr:hypothetical protein [Streptomyces fuscichromogenes]
MIDAIAWKFQTGSPRMHLPAGSGHGRASAPAYGTGLGIWEQAFAVSLAQADPEGDWDLVVAVDSTTVRVRQNTIGARKE